MKVKLITITPSAEKTIVEIARVSSSRKNKTDNISGLINYLIKNKHFSPFEHGSMTIEIETSKAIGIQLIRHRSFTFQEFCISGDSLVKLWYPESKNSKQVSIKNLYDRYNSSYWDRNGVPRAKVFDEDLGVFVSKKILEVFKTGEKELYELVLENGSKIKSTEDHKFFTNKGFRTLETLKVGDFIACNGIDVHQSKDWMKKAKEESLNRNGVQYIADKAGVSYHTIRKWLKIHGLQFSKKETAIYTEVWNKGLPKEDQPMFNKTHTYETRLKQKESSNKGSESNLYTGSEISWRKRVAYECAKHKSFLATKQGISLRDLHMYEVDHINPVYSHPEMAFDIDNLQLLTKEDHEKKSKKELLESKYTVRYSPIKSIKYVGIEMTYDLEVDHDSHNYVANGIVTHNSQRYAVVDGIESIELRRQHANNRQSSTEKFNPQIQIGEVKMPASEHIDALIKNCKIVYKSLLDAGVARECARMVLPMATQTTIYMTGTIRSWMHFIEIRDDEHAQLEIQLIAKDIKEVFQSELPLISEALGW